MEFFEDAVTKAKDLFDVAYKKTEEAVNTGKQKLDIASLKTKCDKDFEALGKLYFETVKDETTDNEAINELVNSIKDKKAKIAKLKQEIDSAKAKTICPDCGEKVDAASQFCPKCGAKLSPEE